jgi:hypothetical protein
MLPFIPNHIGNWWNNNEEIDLIVLGDANAILVECKWASKLVGIDILAELERKTGLLRLELEPRKIGFALCSRSGFTPRLIEESRQRNDVQLFDRAEIVG